MRMTHAAMKTQCRTARLKRSLALFAGLLCFGVGLAQSGGGPGGGAPGGGSGSALESRTYDTVLTGIGYGNYNLQFPQWDPQGGTLTAVRIRALVTVHYGYTLRNADVNPSIYSVQVGREDYFSSAALATPYDNIMEKRIGSFPLNPGATQSQAPFTLWDQYNNTDSITDNVAPFMGRGKIALAYSPITWTDVHTNNNSSYYYSATVRDTTRFSVTYFYKAGGVPLAASFMGFDARLEGAGTVKLDWKITGEEWGRRYVVELARDGGDFAPVSGEIPATAGGGVDAAYQYLYPLTGGIAAGAGNMHLSFRIKMIDISGSIAYSALRQLDIPQGAAGAAGLFPNPATDYVQISYVPGTGGEWTADICAADGRAVLQARFSRTDRGRVNFEGRLARGIYFVRVRMVGNGQGEAQVWALLVQ
jgi:hypothetical protein